MLFRKTRTHFQGASNRSADRLSMTSSISVQGATNFAKTQTKFIETNNPFSSVLKKRSQKQRQHNKTWFNQTQKSASGESGFVTSGVEKKLKRMHKNSKDVVKLLKNWGFSERGCISKEELSSQIERRLGMQLKETDLDQLLRKHSCSQEYLNSEGLVSLLLGKAEGIPIDTMHLPMEQNNTFRDKLVDNLKEDVKNYNSLEKTNLTDQRINSLMSKFNTSISRMKGTQNGSITSNKAMFFQQLKRHNKYNNFELQLLNNIEKTINFQQVHNLLSFHRNADYLFVDPLIRNIKKQAEQTCNIKHKYLATETDVQNLNFANQMKSLPNLFKASLRSEDKRAPFDPLAMTNVNQRKTRFNQSQFTNQSGGWHAISMSETTYPIQRGSAINTLQGEAALKQARYENKLTKMRQYRDKEQENIRAKDEVQHQREKTSMEHIRDQQQAYNYINFIKKKW